MKHVILAGVAIIEFLTAAVFLTAFYIFAEEESERHARASIQWALSAVEQELSLFVSKVETVSDLTLGISETEILDLSNPDQIERYLFDALKASPGFTGLYFGGTDGSFVFVTREAPQANDGEVFIRRVSVFGDTRIQTLSIRNPDFRIVRQLPNDGPVFDPRTRPWYDAAIDEDGPRWSAPYVFYTSKRPGITVSNRVRAEPGGPVVGVIGLDLSFDDLSRFIRELDISENGKAFIADPQGSLVAFPSERPDGATSTRLIDDADPVAAAAFRQALQSGTELPMIASLKVDGERYAAAVDTLTLQDGRWVIGAYAPRSDFMAWFDRVTYATFWLTIALMAAGMVGGVLLWRTVQRRLARIQAGAEAMIEDSCRPFDYEPSGFAELQTTERALSVMADAVAEREDRLVALSERLAEVMRAVDKMPIGIGVFMPYGPVRYVNALAAEILGLSGDEKEEFDTALTARIDAIAKPDTGPDGPPTLAEAFARQEAWEGEILDLDLRGKDDGVTYRMLVVPLAPKSAGRYVFAVQDVTHQKSMERSLVTALDTATEASQAKSMFLANMSHELRTPLNAIIGYSEMLRSEMFGPLGAPRYLEYAENIAESGEWLLEILSNLLDLTAIESGKLTLKSEAQPLAPIVSAAIRPYIADLQKKGIAVETTVDPDLTLRADAVKLRQAVANVVQNALRYAQGADRLRIWTEARDGDGIALILEDNGCGLPPDRFAIVLEPFQRSVGNSLIAATDGVGLGLPISKAIAEIHGGTFQLETPPSGIGLRAVLILPSV